MNACADERLFDWDIFCRVVDNFGDIGVCWRLAKGLAGDHGLAVRLWIDDLEAFSRLCPEISTVDGRLLAAGVEIRRWSRDFPSVEPAAAVIEAFGCALPESYLAAMAARPSPPPWVNLEYLSAENWVDDCHRMTSPHPRLPLLKHFFFPGFSPRTAGLLRERGLIDARDRFQARPALRDALLRSLGVAPPPPGTRLISLFAYAQPALAALLARWANGDAPVLLLVPEGPVVGDVMRFFGDERVAPGACRRRGALTAAVLPFVDQERYDRLLWACDVNFVRGEDSFVRAQWAAQPFAWHIYRQEQDAHRIKLEAFLDRYTATMERSAAAAVRQFWLAWNGWGDVAAAWRLFEVALPALRAHNRSWAQALASAPDLASSLVQFSRNAVK
ncbi:elongation factor P maturation arginine rhamnosyltransferase EarP [Aromatoleum aromaticum]|uniref:elongation factor P maturation arginine rhamnosyltransferase EarP n=1 Tax=Aromatoleum aromaticum TaxID=551760 RepID=UPI001459BCD5|nr:elongation factor P maturation arginine rhamnosyltransferase EarP [Aromatoleum aromaticum]NMG53574.1 elongation factor P maturation arginine rhamnosyltransferase EarP [Aromatoleum aromaticum]